MRVDVTPIGKAIFRRIHQAVCISRCVLGFALADGPVFKAGSAEFLIQDQLSGAFMPSGFRMESMRVRNTRPLSTEDIVFSDERHLFWQTATVR